MANDSDLPQSETEGPERGFDTRSPHRTATSAPAFGRLALCTAAAGALAFGVLGTVAYGLWFNHDQQAYSEAIAGVRQALGMPGAASVVAAGSAMNRLAEPVALSGPAGSATVPVTAATSSHTMPTTPALKPGATENALAVPSAPATTAATPRASTTPTPPSAPTTSTASSTQAALEVKGEEGSKQAVWSGQVAQAPAKPAPTTTTMADATFATPASSPSPRSTRHAINGAEAATQQSSPGRTGKDARAAQSERRVASANANANARHKNSLFARMGLLFRRVNYRQHDSGRQQQDIYSHP
jgi:hypothetical protein